MALASVYRLPATCSWLSSGGSSAARPWQLGLRCFLSCPGSFSSAVRALQLAMRVSSAQLPAACSLPSRGSSAARPLQLATWCLLSCGPIAACHALLLQLPTPCGFSSAVRAMQLAMRLFSAQLPARCKLPSRVSLAALPLQLAIRVLSAARSSQRDTSVSAVQLALRVFWAQLPALCRLPSTRSSAARPFPLPLRVSSAQLPAPCSLHCVFCPPLAACHPSFVSCPLFAACIACFLSTASAPCSLPSGGSSTVRLLQLAICCVSSPVGALQLAMRVSPAACPLARLPACYPVFILLPAPFSFQSSLFSSELFAPCSWPSGGSSAARPLHLAICCASSAARAL